MNSQIIMSLSLCYDLLTYKTLEWFTLTNIATPTPNLIFTLITFGTNIFIVLKSYIRILFQNLVYKNESARLYRLHLFHE